MMKKLVASLFGLLVMSSVALADPPAGYVQTFDDEFTSLSISNSATNDGSTWYTETVACCMSTSDGTGNYLYPGYGSVAQGLTSPFSLIPGGGLNITLSKQLGTNAPYNQTPWWVGGLISTMAPDGKGFAQQYGYFEMKAKLPANAPGTWPAFWMFPAAGYASNHASWGDLKNDGEIDIMDGYGQFLTGSGGAYSITLHDWLHGTTPGQINPTVGDMTNAYHTYGMLWTKDTLTFYFDGTQVAQFPTPAVMRQPYYLIADLGMGGGWPTDATPNPSSMQIAYIKAWQAPESGSTNPPPPPPPPPPQNTIFVTEPAHVTAPVGSTAVSLNLHMNAIPTPGYYQVCVRVLNASNIWQVNYNDCFWPPQASATASGDEDWPVTVSLPAGLPAGNYTITAIYTYYDGSTFTNAPMNMGAGVTASPESGITNAYAIGTITLQ